MIARLRQEQASVWPRLTKTMDMGEIEEFARRLDRWAAEGQCAGLKTHATALLREVEVFVVEALTRTLSQFPAVCEEVFNQQAKGA